MNTDTPKKAGRQRPAARVPQRTFGPPDEVGGLLLAGTVLARQRKVAGTPAAGKKAARYQEVLYVVANGFAYDVEGWSEVPGRPWPASHGDEVMLPVTVRCRLQDGECVARICLRPAK